jgi:methylenetetrahydrofolate reductase (NADPH)
MLADLVRERSRPIVTAEFPSIDAGTIDTIADKLAPISPYVDAINVTDNPAAHVHASNVSMAIALQQLGAEPIMQVVCRDKNRLAIQADIVGAAMFGIRNICALTGDDVTAGDEPEARRVYDLDGPQLVAVATGISRGHYLSGREIDPAPDLLVGAVENPFAPPFEHRPERALKKVDAGARFLQLQIGYQPDILEAFMSACVANGVAERAAILPTVILTKRAGALKFMEGHVAGIHVPDDVIAQIEASDDQAEASYQYVRAQVEHILGLPGVAGVHITDFRHDGSLGRLVEDCQIGPRFEEHHAHSVEFAQQDRHDRI